MRSASRLHSMSFEAIGTHWQIDTDTALTAAQWRQIHCRIEDFDRTYSRFRADSLVSKIADAPGTFEFGGDCLPLIGFYRRLYEITGGAVTPLVGATLEDLGYDADYRLTPRPAIRSTPAWDAVMTWDGTTLHTTAPIVLDVGAAGKGYLIDILGEQLASFGVRSFVVDGSGDLLHRGPDVLRVGLEHPADPSKVIGVVPLTNSALAASAANRRAWGTTDRVLHHIVEPTSGEPVSQIVAGWAVAGSAMIADGVATALFFVDDAGLAELGDAFGASWLRVSGNGSARWSATFEGELNR